MSSDLRMALIGIVAAASGRNADLIDLEVVGGLVLARAPGGREIYCDAVATRQRMIAKVRCAVGFRNVLVHGYTGVDWKIVMRVIRTDTRDLAAFGKAVLKMLENGS